MLQETWKYKGVLITELTDMPKDAMGIIYIITTEEGKMYIGRKSLFSVRRRKLGKRKLAAMVDKRGSKYEIIKKESDWRAYTGSNIPLNKEIDNGMKYTKNILHYAYNKKHLNYLETRELFSRGVLECDIYYNSNISGKFFFKDTH